ncbi:hypothetical protein GGP41_003165 [Bipolaris sorokiniana]|uniref:Uncharacterized protein n=1 Tax=Cochliobolus sativus TaxID=45130 RepID=A0A8H6DSZ7_COCSA|nr:hypothetical protein GGP41_003165 [Bipolaris sorokiniana]
MSSSRRRSALWLPGPLPGPRVSKFLTIPAIKRHSLLRLHPPSLLVLIGNGTSPTTYAAPLAALRRNPSLNVSPKPALPCMCMLLIRPTQ